MSHADLVQMLMQQGYLKEDAWRAADMFFPSPNVGATESAHPRLMNAAEGVVNTIDKAVAPVQIKDPKAYEAQRKEQISATRLLKEYIMHQDAQRAAEEEKNALWRATYSFPEAPPGGKVPEMWGPGSDYQIYPTKPGK